jgi:hypothetical protein
LGYDYLLLCAEPVSLDHIAADLEMGKGGTGVAARLLAKCTLGRHYGERGSKRAFVKSLKNDEGMLTEQNRLLDALPPFFEPLPRLVRWKRRAIVSKRWPNFIWQYAARWT